MTKKSHSIRNTKLKGSERKVPKSATSKSTKKKGEHAHLSKSKKKKFTREPESPHWPL